MSIYVGKTPIYSTIDKILYVESSRSNLINLESTNKNARFKIGDFILAENKDDTCLFVIENDNSNILCISQSNIILTPDSIFDENLSIEGSLNVKGNIQNVGTMNVNSDLNIGGILNASIINTSNISILSKKEGKIFTAGSNSENGLNHEIMYIDVNNNLGNVYINGSLGVGIEPNINYSISCSSKMLTENNLYAN